MIDHVEAGSNRPLFDPIEIFEIDIVDGKAFAFCIRITVNQINDSAADAPDGRDAQLHRAGFHRDRFCAFIEKFFIGLLRIANSETHAACRGAVLARKKPCGASRFVVEDEVDLTLTPEIHVLRSVRGHMGKSHGFKDRFDDAFFGSAEFDELESVESDWIFEEIGHFNPLGFARWFQK